MNRLLVLGISGLVGIASAQHAPLINTGATGVGTGNGGLIAPQGAYPYGNILFPGGIQQSHPQRLGSTVAGNPWGGGGIGTGRGAGGHSQRNRTVVVPYAVPIYVGGGGYGNGYDMPPQQPNVTVVVPQAPAPTVVINQSFVPETAKPQMRDYSNSDLPEAKGGMHVYEAPSIQPRETEKKTVARVADDQATIYLIALKDGGVKSAIGYWVQDDTLHYVTTAGVVNRVSMSMVDKATSEQLNAERKVEFSLKKD